MTDLATLLQFIYEGDWLGLLQAVYVSGFQSSDVFYGMLGFMFTGAVYVRTKSLLLVSILWILLGTTYLVAMPIVSAIAILLVGLGLGGMLFKIYLMLKG